MSFKKISILFLAIFNYTIVHSSEIVLTSEQREKHGQLSIYMGIGEQKFLKAITSASPYDLNAIMKYQNPDGGGTLLHNFVHCLLKPTFIIAMIDRLTDATFFTKENSYGETPLYVGCSMGVTHSTVIMALVNQMQKTQEGRNAITRKIWTNNGLEARYTSALSQACSHEKSESVIECLVKAHLEADKNDPHLVEVLARYHRRYRNLDLLYGKLVGWNHLEDLIIRSENLVEKERVALQEKLAALRLLSVAKTTE